MKTPPENATLVIAGNWNPAILSPQWIAKTILNLPPEQQFPLQMEMVISQASTHRMIFLGLTCLISPQALVFFLNTRDVDSCTLACRTARRIVEVLSHTPITGVGFNFEFLLDHPQPQFLDRFPTVQLDNADVVSKSWGVKLNSVENLITLDANFEGVEGKLAMNFHHGTNNTNEAAVYLTENKVQQLFDEATSIAERVTGETVEDEIV